MSQSVPALNLAGDSTPALNYRLYSFVVGLYMKEIQWGIQTAHGTAQLMGQVMHHLMTDDEDLTMRGMAWQLINWSVPGRTDGPTKIVLDARNYQGLMQLREELAPLAAQLKLPFTAFHEDEASLGGIFTNVVVLVPSTLYDVTIDADGENAFNPYITIATQPNQLRYYPGTPEYDLISIIKSYPLVR
jgi:hypothetical protein